MTFFVGDGGGKASMVAADVLGTGRYCPRAVLAEACGRTTSHRWVARPARARTHPLPGLPQSFFHFRSLAVTNLVFPHPAGASLVRGVNGFLGP